jgi:hypothetical protein
LQRIASTFEFRECPQIGKLNRNSDGLKWVVLRRRQSELTVSADRQLNRLADPAEHFHEGINGELGRLLIDYIGHPRTRDHQNIGRLDLFQVMFAIQADNSSKSCCFSRRVSLICLRDAACKRFASAGEKPKSRKTFAPSFVTWRISVSNFISVPFSR